MNLLSRLLARLRVRGLPEKPLIPTGNPIKDIPIFIKKRKLLKPRDFVSRGKKHRKNERKARKITRRHRKGKRE